METPTHVKLSLDSEEKKINISDLYKAILNRQDDLFKNGPAISRDRLVYLIQNKFKKKELSEVDLSDINFRVKIIPHMFPQVIHKVGFQDW